MKKTYTLSSCMADYLLLKSERSEWESEWKEISEYLLPGRGLYNTLATPQKRKLTSPKAINTVARDALRVLSSGVQGGLVPSNRPWLEIKWSDKNLNNIAFLKDWLYEAKEILSSDLQNSNFYPVMAFSLTEMAGFGTTAIFVDSDTDISTFNFIPLTVGEYVFTVNYLGHPDKFYRILYMTPRNMADRFGVEKLSSHLQKFVKDGDPQQDKQFVPVLECILPQPYQDKPITRLLWEAGTNSSGDTAMMSYAKTNTLVAQPLHISGFYEFPVSVGRWETLGQDMYGLGPGSEALPEIKRLQEMEKALRMAVHKEIDPPLMAPAYLRGVLSSVPGAKNYYRNPADKVESIYARNFNYQGATAVIDRVEQGIRLKFFNDIFLTASRDPNASPMKAAEVHVKEGEKLLRLGSVIEKITPEFLIPIITRCFNVALRKGRFPEIPPEYAEMLGEITIELVSPLAQAQKLIASRSIEQTMAFVGQAQAIAPDIMDNIDVDKALDEYADAHGTSRRIFRTPEEVQQIRQQRQQAQQQEMNRQKRMQEAELGATVGPADAAVQKTRAETGQIMTESLVDQQGLGGMM